MSYIYKFEPKFSFDYSVSFIEMVIFDRQLWIDEPLSSLPFLYTLHFGIHSIRLDDNDVSDLFSMLMIKMYVGDINMVTNNIICHYVILMHHMVTDLLC